MKKIGIFLDSDTNLFTNGAIQQSYFTYLAIQNTGVETIMLAYDNKTPTFQMFDIPVHSINPETTDTLIKSLQGVDTIIFTSLIPTQKSFVTILKRNNIELIYQICGNYYIINQEDFVFNCHQRKFYETTSLVDKIWLLPMYEHMKSYIETITKVPVYIAPYVWNADIVESSNVHNVWPQNMVPKSSTLKISNQNKHVVLIAEPNVSIHKTALIPSLICENIEYKNKIFMLCSKENTSFNYLLSKLDIYKNIDFHNRLVVVKVLQQIIGNNILPFVVSHQILNELNFLHLEMLYFGIPLVHNCNMLKPSGFFYPDHDVNLGGEQLKTAINNFNFNDYKQKCDLVLSEFNPKNPRVIETYKNLLGI